LPRNCSSETGFPFSSGRVKSGAFDLISISHYLYRKLRNHAIALLAVLALSAVGAAQLRDRTEHKRADEGQDQAQSKKPAKRGPRAIGVIEFSPKGARLVPIALWMDGRYYDASFYGANPAPMVLQPETLYQALSYGEPTGWFTVTTPEQVNGAWVAEGQWKPQLGTFDTKVAQQAAKQAKKKTQSPISDDSGPPVLRRSPSSGSSDTTSTSGSSSGQTTSSSSSKAQAPANDDSDRPVLRSSSPPASTDSSRPTLGPDTSPDTSTAATAPPQTTTTDNDPDRPTLKKPSPSSDGSSSTAASQPTLGGDASQTNVQAPTSPAPPTSSPDENDPDRPTLHRGKPSAQSASATLAATGKPKSNSSAATATTATAPSPKASTATNPQSAHAYPAISDAGNYEIRSLLYAMTPAEKEERGKPILALAQDEVRNYRSKRQQENTVGKTVSKTVSKTAGKTTAKAPAKPETLVVGDYDLRAYDLDFSNSPTFVLTARVNAPPAQPGGFTFDYFVTVVARVDINGETQKVFTSVTDNNHLDAFPRLEIIDAVDADANGRGDLLFRQHSDSSVSYALYRVYPYQMVKVFEGGSNM